jgi:Holliday junction resolvasome RuvABC DNA-binding subunit
MKFYGNGIVWNSARNCKLCKFEDGVFVTDDEGVINALIKLGYKHDEVVEIKEEVKEVVVRPKPLPKKAVTK